MAKLKITRDLTNNVYSATFELTDITIAEGELIQDFGEPYVTFGGAFDVLDVEMLGEYFPEDPRLISDWVQFQEYEAGTEVQYSSNPDIYYVALQDVEFDFPDWAAFTSYTAGDIVKFVNSNGIIGDNKFYKANANVNFNDSVTPTREVTEITVPGAPGDGSYFWLFTKTISHYFYFDSTSGQTVPDPAPVVPAGAPSTASGTKVNIYGFGSNTDIATFISNTVNALAYFDSTPASPPIATIEILHADTVESAGDVKDAEDGTGIGGPTGLTINILINGDDNLLYPVYNTSNEPLFVTGDVYKFGLQYFEAQAPSPINYSPANAPFAVNDIVRYDNGSGYRYYRAINEIPDQSPAIEPSNTVYWQLTNIVQPINDSGVYWDLFTDKNPLGADALWDVYTDKDPTIPISPAYWGILDVSGRISFQSTSFTVNRITRKVPSGLPTTYSFDANINTEAQENAEDFVVIMTKRFDDAWKELLSNIDDYEDVEYINLPIIT